MKLRSGFGLAFAVGLIFAGGVAFAQTAPSNLAFEVATVKPSPPLDMAKLGDQVQAGKMPRFGPHVNASQAEYIYMSLKDLIANAYKVKALSDYRPGVARYRALRHCGEDARRSFQR